MFTRKARLRDAQNIYDLVGSLSGDGTLLHRGFAEICENIRDFCMVESSEGMFLGCSALHLYGPHLAELRSIVVSPAASTEVRVRSLSMRFSLRPNRTLSPACVFTRIREFFLRYGFRIAERTRIPDKIYKDCQCCPRLHACDEVAMARGYLPQHRDSWSRRGEHGTCPVARVERLTFLHEFAYDQP